MVVLPLQLLYYYIYFINSIITIEIHLNIAVYIGERSGEEFEALEYWSENYVQ